MDNVIEKMHDFVIVGLQPWDVEIGSNCKDIAKELSKKHRVLYINAPLDLNRLIKGYKDPAIKKRIQHLKNNHNSEEVAKNIWVYYPDTVLFSINFIGNHRLFNFFNKINNRLFARSIKKAIKKLAFKDFILFNDNEIFRAFYLKEFLQPKVSVYYSRDYLLAVNYWKKHGTDLEPLLISKSDVCVANSPYLADYCKKYNSKSFYVGQGCDFPSPNKENKFIPLDISNISKPVLGYTGALTSFRLDLPAINYIAEKMPLWNIVLIGPEDEDFKKDNIHKQKNVHFLGSKDPSELSDYINYFDVCFNPQLINEVTIGNYPRKIDEYLALGKPVVATKTPAMSIFKEYTYLAESREDYISLIQLALEEDNSQLQIQRTEFAAGHSWENSVKEILKAVNSVIK